MRILIIMFFLLVLFCAVEARLYHLQIRRHHWLSQKAMGIHTRKRVIEPLRGEILDRSSNVLAVSTRLNSVYVNTSVVSEEKGEELAKRLAPVLSLPESKIQARLKRKGHIPLSRKVCDETADQVEGVRKELGLKRNALYFRPESKRYYPMGRLLAPVIGFTTIDDTGDNKGIFGIELKYNEWISGKYEKCTARRTALRQNLEPIEKSILEETFGNRVVLTIDQSIQYALERALRKALSEQRADSAMGVVQDCRTGEILALCSLPTFDPEKFYTFDKDFRRNRCISDVLEPGSVQKIITSAILFDLGLVGMEEIIDCEGGRAVVEGRRVTDAGGHSMDRVPFCETFYHSSNIAFSKLGLRIDPPVYFTYLRSFGFGQKTGIDLPDESGGILYPLSKWTKLSRTSLPIGYEIGLTPLQVACAVSAMGNGGKLMRPYIVSEIQDSKGRVLQKMTPRVKSQVVSPETALKVLSLMEGVVRKGTGKKAGIKGYRIGGKTGTTRKSDRSEPEYIAGFAGIFPIEDPRITCYVAIDNPKESYYAAQVAVPVFREVAAHILSHLAIPPSVPVEETIMAAADPEESPTPVSSPRRTVVIEGEMPDLSGLTMKEALRCLGDFSGELKFIGSGVVIDQTPRAAIPFKDVKKCVVVFGKPSGGELE